MPTLKLTDGEFAVLVAYWIDGTTSYKEADYKTMIDKVRDIHLYNKVKKPTVNAVWEALKGVVG
jgi:hypothetical protein